MNKKGQIKLIDEMIQAAAEETGFSVAQVNLVLNAINKFCEESFEKQWKQRVAELKKLQKHGLLENFIKNYEAIYHWLKNTQALKENGNLSEDKLQELSELGL